MKFFHISDLHIGKRVCGFSMLEDQKYILEQIVNLAAERRPQGILIAGDLYDKSMPSAEAVELADWFLSRLAELEIPVWTVCGNHDSAERIAYGAEMLEKAGIYMSRAFDGRPQRYTVSWDGSGKPEILRRNGENSAEPGQERGAALDREGEKADIYLLPFIRPAQARRFFPEKTIENTHQAVEAALAGLPVEKNRTNILVMHQFMAGAAVCESEEISVGGSDQVDAAVADGFDYVALGHLHGPQRVGREEVRYCGSPLKYSFSEARHQKSLTIIETGAEEEKSGETPEGRLGTEGEKSGEAPEGRPGIEGEKSGDLRKEIMGEESRSGAETAKRKKSRVRVYTVPLVPRRDMREIRGPIEELLRPEVVSAADPEDYLHITLTDEGEVLDAMGRLRESYPNIMRLDFEAGESLAVEEEEILVEEKTPMALFEEFYLVQNGREMDEEQKKTAAGIWEEARMQ